MRILLCSLLVFCAHSAQEGSERFGMLPRSMRRNGPGYGVKPETEEVSDLDAPKHRSERLRKRARRSWEGLLDGISTEPPANDADAPWDKPTLKAGRSIILLKRPRPETPREIPKSHQGQPNAAGRAARSPGVLSRVLRRSAQHPA